MPVNRRNVPASEPIRRRRKTDASPEARESRLISLAEELAERQMLDGTASAQVVTHYLKLGSSRERMEQERLAGEVKLQMARIEAMESTKRVEELYIKAMAAFQGYQGREPEIDEEFDDE